MSPHFAQSPVAELVAKSQLPMAGQGGALQTLAIADVSSGVRFGCKGPGTATWLSAFGLPIPPQPNTWMPLPAGGRIARLGFTEFLIEGEQASPLLAASRVAGVYPVLRQDAAFVLTGANLPELLLQTCSVNFRALDLSASPVVLTSMVGVGVTAILEQRLGRTELRLWCDGTYGHYLWETLLDIAVELDGGAVASHHFD